MKYHPEISYSSAKLNCNASSHAKLLRDVKAMYHGLIHLKHHVYLQLCEEYMEKFPVISITLKGATEENFEEAKVMLRRIIGKEEMRFQFLLESDKIDDTERSQYKALISTDKSGTFTILFLLQPQVHQKLYCYCLFQKNFLTYSWLMFFQNVLGA